MLIQYPLNTHKTFWLTRQIEVNKNLIFEISLVKSPQISPVWSSSDIEQILFQKFAHLYSKIPLLQVKIPTFGLFFRRY